MNYANYAALVNAINIYNDNVLHEAQKFAIAICERNEDYCTSVLFDEISASTDNLGKDACWQHEQLQNAIDTYNDEDVDDALQTIAIAMIKRSDALEKAFN